MTERVLDISDVGFWEGRQFRISFELSIPTGTTQYIRFIAAADFALLRQELSVDANGVKFTALRDATTGGTWTAIAPRAKNIMSTTSQYTAKTVIESGTLAGGANVSGGVVTETIRVVASGATAQAATVGATAGDQRGLPAGTYLLAFQCLGNGTATGVYTLIFEERPSGVTKG